MCTKSKHRTLLKITQKVINKIVKNHRIWLNKELEYKINEYEAAITKLKLSNGQFCNENEELNEEIDELRRDYSTSQTQNKALNKDIDELK